MQIVIDIMFVLNASAALSISYISGAFSFVFASNLNQSILGFAKYIENTIFSDRYVACIQDLKHEKCEL